MSWAIPWAQIAGAISGGLIGGFTGFVANAVLDRHSIRRARRNVASALIGEIQALGEFIENHYLAKLQEDMESIASDGRKYPYHGFRGEREYAPVFRSLGGDMGMLPSPLPRDLVYWYTGLTVCLERARDLRDLGVRGDQDTIVYALELAQLQRASFDELSQLSRSLLAQLSAL